jgi:hypothetical protein
VVLLLLLLLLAHVGVGVFVCRVVCSVSRCTAAAPNQCSTTVPITNDGTQSFKVVVNDYIYAGNNGCAVCSCACLARLCLAFSCLCLPACLSVIESCRYSSLVNAPVVSKVRRRGCDCVACWLAGWLAGLLAAVVMAMRRGVA